MTDSGNLGVYTAGSCHDIHCIILSHTGAGGCCRLPRLIGFRQSLSLLLTGQAITAQKALKLGLVDYLMPNMETVVRKGEKSGEGKSYEYKWLSGLLACVDQRKVGKRRGWTYQEDTNSNEVQLNISQKAITLTCLCL